MEEITIGYISHHGPEVFDKFLGFSLENLQGKFSVIKATDNKFSAAKNYNYIIDKSQTDLIAFAHEDVSFSPDLISCLEETIKEVGDFSVLGLVGVDFEGNYHWSNEGEIFELCTVDQCFFVIRKSHGVRFDEITFDDFHLHAEDYCQSCRLKTSLPVFTIKTNSRESSPLFRDESIEKYLNHHSATCNKEGYAWGKYWHYRKKLEEKFPKIKTT